MYHLKGDEPAPVAQDNDVENADESNDSGLDGEKKRHHKWTNTHSLYAIMGGFAFSTEDLEPNFLWGSPVRQTITVSGLTLLARCKPNSIPDLSEEDIVDKSKADGFKKFILCIQAGRFLSTTIFRMATGYTISLLELNTFAHCICALMVYAFWWSKPLDVQEPTIVPLMKYRELVALFSMGTKGDQAPRELDIFQHQPERSQEYRVKFHSDAAR